MADAGASARAATRSVADSFRVLSLEQKVAAVASLLLIASTFGPFSFVEAAEIVTALGVLALLHFRAQGRTFHLPFGDGTVIAAAGVWVGLLIVVRLFDRPLGQNLLALVCAAILAVAGASERAKRPPDDLPEEPRPARRPRATRAVPTTVRGPAAVAVGGASTSRLRAPRSSSLPTRDQRPDPIEPTSPKPLAVKRRAGRRRSSSRSRTCSPPRTIRTAEPTRRLPRDQDEG